MPNIHVPIKALGSFIVDMGSCVKRKIAFGAMALHAFSFNSKAISTQKRPKGPLLCVK